MEATNIARITHRTGFALLLVTLLTLPVSVFAASIGIAAVATDTQLKGKGEFNINDEVNVGDVIQTGKAGSVTILFNDESMLTLGPNSSASLDIYKEGKPGESRITIIDGNFRYFPGEILEKGGSQVVINKGASSSLSSTEAAIAESGLDANLESSSEVLDIKVSEIDIVIPDTALGIDTDGGTTGTSQPGDNNADIGGPGAQ